MIACRKVMGMRSRRPSTLMRTPFSMQCVVSAMRYSCSNRRIALTSEAGLFQFAEESANSVNVCMPIPGAASMIARLASAPARCPADRGNPREVAHRPLPSVMMAT